MTASKRILAISFFYKNNEPNGIGITFTQDMGNLNSILDIIRDSYDTMWMECLVFGSIPALVHDLRAQLDAIGLKKPIENVKTAMLALGNIYLLEKQGALRSDEFNGLLIAYEDD